MRNLSRLNAAANRTAATQDLKFVYRQLEDYNPPIDWSVKLGSARQIDRLTRKLITWAKENNIEIKLPEGWTP